MKVISIACWPWLHNELLETKGNSVFDHLLHVLYSPLDPDDNLSYTSWLHFTMSLFEGNAAH